MGVYQNGVTLGTGVRFFTSAFETAWAPFYYDTARQPDARDVFRRMTTYGVAVIALLVAVTTAVAHDAILVMLTPEWIAASRVIPFIAIGLGLQGVYLLTSIGLNLTSRTELYAVSTFSALGVGLGLGVWLMPRYGVTGAAVAFMLSYATQTAVAFVLARRVYPIRYETGRLARVLAAGVVAAVAGVWVLPEMPPIAGLLLRAAVTVAVFAGGSGGDRIPARDRARVCRGDDRPVPPAARGRRAGRQWSGDTAAATRRSASVVFMAAAIVYLGALWTGF